MLLTLILCGVAAYFALVVPAAVVVGRMLRGPVEPYVAGPAVTLAMEAKAPVAA